MARIALAGFMHETNTFAPLPTNFESFTGKNGYWIDTPEEFAAMKEVRANVSAIGFMIKAEEFGHEVFPILLAAAQPACTVTNDAFEQIMSHILEGIKNNGPFDAVYLDLHGAMVTKDFQDPETEAQRRIRQVVGDIPLIGTLDLHGNIPSQAVEGFSALVGYRSYPHIDMFETGERAAILADHLLHGKPLKKAYRQLPYLISPSTASTFTEPCLSIYKELDNIEKNEQVQSVTFMHGFLLSDIEHAGPSVFAYADTQKAADKAADQLLQALLKHEAGFALNLLPPDEAVHQAIEKSMQTEKPIVLADVQDNAGGGGTSDTVWILEELLKQGAQETALGLMYDPEAAELIHTAGEGSQITLDLGGKLMPGHKPLHGTFTVEKIFGGEFDLTGSMNRGIKTNMGKMACIRSGGVQVVVCSIRKQNNDQAYFRIMGIDPTRKKILVVKSTNHYRADYQPIASEIIMVEAPGAHIENPTTLAYKNLRAGVRLGGLGPEFNRTSRG